MTGGARWILIGTAMMLIAGALSWSCGGGGGTPCTVNAFGTPVGNCATPAPPGPFLQKIAVCLGPPPTPTPIPSSSASPSATPIETPCPAPSPTTVPQGCTLQFHAVGTFSDDSTQDITDSSSTTWTTSDRAVVDLNPSPPANYFTAGTGTATINADSGSISGQGIRIKVTPPGPACPASGASEDGEAPSPDAPPFSDWQQAPR